MFEATTDRVKALRLRHEALRYVADMERRRMEACCGAPESTRYAEMCERCRHRDDVATTVSQQLRKVEEQFGVKRRWCRLGDHLLHTDKERQEGMCAACAEVWAEIEAEVGRG